MKLPAEHTGIFSRGNIKPVNITVGSNIPINEINMAVCCDAVELEISNPKRQSGNNKQCTFQKQQNDTSL